MKVPVNPRNKPPVPPATRTPSHEKSFSPQIDNSLKSYMQFRRNDFEGKKMTHRWTVTLCALGLLASCQSPTQEWFLPVPPGPTEKDNFCEWSPYRNDSEVLFSKPLRVEEGDLYEIRISADFENHASDFEYPNPLICTVTLEDGIWDGGCPDYTPTVAEFSFDNVPNWQYDEDKRAIGFRWYRLVSSADIRLTKNGDVLFDGEVEFEQGESECHGFDHSEHPEYGEAYRFAKAEIDTSD